MHYHKHRGIILKKTPVKDADYFLTILTKDDGKLSVYAKGIRSLLSKRRASLDYFSEIDFEVIEKNSRLTLMSVELVDGYTASKQKLPDISRLFQIGDLVEALLPEGEPNLAVYSLLQTALTHLERFQTPDYLTRFKLKLLELLGYQNPSLTVGKTEGLDDYIESLLDRPLKARIS
jgi:DNA repair protein RecO (recombination protein O)